MNGVFAAYHEGGHTPFCVDITPFLRDSDNTLVVRAEDCTTGLHQPRGKQYWQTESASIFYTRTTGIWQTVWLEPVGDVYLDSLRLTPDIDNATLTLEYVLAGNWTGDIEFETEIMCQSERVGSATFTPDEARTAQTLSVSGDLHLWRPESPALYDLAVRVKRRADARRRAELFRHAQDQH